MKNGFYWILFFFVCFLFGLLQGLKPQGSSIDFFPPKHLSVLMTDEALLPEDLRRQLEEDLSVQLSILVTRDWDAFTVKLVESPSADIVLGPSFWAKTLEKQNLLFDLKNKAKWIHHSSPDFLNQSPHGEMFYFPLFWMKTSLEVANGKTLSSLLDSKEPPTIQLIADEDLILLHLREWERKGLLPRIQKSKILSVPLDKVKSDIPTEGVSEIALRRESSSAESSGALLNWGAFIPQNSTNKELALKVLHYLGSKKTHEQWITKTPFNSTLRDLSDKVIPLNRRSEWVRDLSLKNAVLIEEKDQEARKKLRDLYQINIL